MCSPLPPRLECVAGGKAVPWKPVSLKWTRQTPVGVEWEAVSEARALRLTVRGRMEFDGFMQLRMELGPSDAHGHRWTTFRFVVPWAKDAVKYAMGLGLQGGECPAQLPWKWDVSKHQDAIWLGDVNAGAMLRFKGSNYRRPLINAYYDFRPLNLPDSWGGGGIEIDNHARPDDAHGQLGQTRDSAPAARLRLRHRLVLHALQAAGHARSTSPIASIMRGRERRWKTSPPSTKQGANIIEVHHNRLCNPYINYPYNDDSIGQLTEFIKQGPRQRRARERLLHHPRTDAEPAGVLRPEEPRRRGDPAPPRRRGLAGHQPRRPASLAAASTSARISCPAWRENLHYPRLPEQLDLAVITTPDSRWNNFYLAGLDYLVKKAGIDGLYIDDTALDRKSMQRARRILDADGNPGRRVNMHSWNHFNGLAKWTNSSIAFMELYPYYDGLWHGEGFNANASPEYMLVEMSGIPFGLMSEMLDHPNLWHGMVFGMRSAGPGAATRGTCGSPKTHFGIADAEFIGWWDAACPVQTGEPDVKASVYRRAGQDADRRGKLGQGSR